MSHHNDYFILDRPEILQFVFYPRKDTRRGPPNSTDYSVSVEDEVSIGCRFYVHSNSSPSILLFHGNGEIVSDYDGIAPVYNQVGINLFVADYRGYGSSGGMPTFTNMVSDAYSIFEAFGDILRNDHHSGNTFVMGRSLGSICAIELASSYQEQIKGLIIESGFASILRLLNCLGLPAEFVGINDITFPNVAKVRSITLPTLILHGERDSIIPVTEARSLFENAAAKSKHLVIINGADHNDIMLVGIEKYFKAIREFILERGG
mgnify:CR=1 FL=1